MSKNHLRNKNRSNSPGGFAGIPRVVMNNSDYTRLSGGAVKLLLEFCRQYKGSNNGNITAAFSILKQRGFNSKETIKRTKNELLSAGLIIETREGRFTNPGGVCALYAITWQPIDECPGKNLNVEPTTTPYRKFSLQNNETPSPDSGQESAQKTDRCKQRDEQGRFTSVQKPPRLTAVT
jgi:hypothetical protein